MIDFPSIGAVVNWVVVAAGDAAGKGALGEAARDAYNGLRQLCPVSQDVAVNGGGANASALATCVNALSPAGRQRAAGLANYLLQMLIDGHDETGYVNADDLRAAQARLGELVVSGFAVCGQQSAQ